MQTHLVAKKLILLPKKLIFPALNSRLDWKNVWPPQHTSQYVTNPVGGFSLYLGERGRSEDYREAARAGKGNKNPLGKGSRSLRSKFPGFSHEADTMGMLPHMVYCGQPFLQHDMRVNTRSSGPVFATRPTLSLYYLGFAQRWRRYFQQALQCKHRVWETRLFF